MARRFNRSVKAFFLGAVIIFSGCSFSFLKVEYSKAKKAADKKKYSKAIEHFENVLKRSPESEMGLDSARQAARIAELEIKDFKRAIQFYEHIFYYSPQAKERIIALQNMALISLEKLQDFDKAIEFYNKAIAAAPTGDLNIENRINLAKAYYYRGEFKQAETEIDAVLKVTDKPEKRFEVEQFKANVCFNTNRLLEAVKIYEKLLKEHPGLSEKNNIGMNIAIAYEELENFDQAILKLEQLRGSYKDEQFLDLKIARLKERKANLPGARGLRK